MSNPSITSNPTINKQHIFDNSPLVDFIDFAKIQSIDKAGSIFVARANIGHHQVGIYAHNPLEKKGACDSYSLDSLINTLRAWRNENRAIIGLINSSGADFREGALANDAFGRLYKELLEIKSSSSLHLAIFSGDSYGGGFYGGAQADYRVILEDTTIRVAGSKVAKSVRGFSGRDGPNSKQHSESGFANWIVRDKAAAFELVENFLNLLDTNRAYIYLEPLDSDKKFDMLDFRLKSNHEPSHLTDLSVAKHLISLICDSSSDQTSSFIEISSNFGRSITIGFGRIDDSPVAIIANNRQVKSGALTHRSCEKIVETIRFCSHKNIPIVFLVDCPGIQPSDYELDQNIGKAGADLFAAQVAAQNIPKFAIIFGNGIGGARTCLASTTIGIYPLAWNTATIGTLGSKAIRSISSSESKETVDLTHLVEQGIIREIINPKATRTRLIELLNESKQKKIKPGEPFDLSSLQLNGLNKLD